MAKKSKKKNKLKSNTLMLANMALMIALNIVLSRFLVIYITESARISFGGLPIFLVSFMYGPLAGAIVGGASDILGAVLFSPLGWNPIMTVSPVILGLVSGILKKMIIDKKISPFRIISTTMLSHIICSMLLGTGILTYIYGKESFWVSFFATGSVRVPIYILVAIVEGLGIYLLAKRKIVKIT